MKTKSLIWLADGCKTVFVSSYTVIFSISFAAWGLEDFKIEYSINWYSANCHFIQRRRTSELIYDRLYVLKTFLTYAYLISRIINANFAYPVKNKVVSTLKIYDITFQNYTRIHNSQN